MRGLAALFALANGNKVAQAQAFLTPMLAWLEQIHSVAQKEFMRWLKVLPSSNLISFRSHPAGTAKGDFFCLHEGQQKCFVPCLSLL
jgi:hypothetical protein